MESLWSCWSPNTPREGRIIRPRYDSGSLVSIDSYLSDRHFQIKIGKVLSSKTPLGYDLESPGINTRPPFICNTYERSCSASPEWNAHDFFGDNATQYSSDMTFQNVEENLNTDIQPIVLWNAKNKMVPKKKKRPWLCRNQVKCQSFQIISVSPLMNHKLKQYHQRNYWVFILTQRWADPRILITYAKRFPNGWVYFDAFDTTWHIMHA